MAVRAGVAPSGRGDTERTDSSPRQAAKESHMYIGLGTLILVIILILILT